MPTIVVCGDRNWTCRRTIAHRLRQLNPAVTHLVVGDWGVAYKNTTQRGADLLVQEVARIMGFMVTVVPTDWSLGPYTAGPARNKRMFEEHRPTLLLVFHDDPAASRGATRSCLAEAAARQVPVEVVHSLPPEVPAMKIPADDGDA